MGLFEDIWDWMASKVQGLINASLTTFKYWVNAAIKAAIGAVDWVVTNITNVVNNVYNTVKKYITNVYETINKYITNISKYITEEITNVYNTTEQFITNVTKNITNITNNDIVNITKNITNVIGVLDPMGFLKDPRGYITAMFDLLIAPRGHGIVKSFWEGLEEGLEE